MDRERIAQAERRELQRQHRAAGGSERRPARSFLTAEEKRARREEHGERLRTMVEWIAADPEAAGLAILDARRLHPNLSATNAALLGYQVPGRIANTVKGWRREGAYVRKGEGAAGWITGPGFWPLAVFTGEQLTGGAPEWAAGHSPLGLVGNEAARIGALVEECERGPKKVAEAVAALLDSTREDDRPALSGPVVSVEEVAIPF